MDEIPAIAIEISKDGHGPIRGVTGLAHKVNAEGAQPLVVAPEVIGLQKKKDSSTALVADGLRLFWCGGTRQQQRCSARTRRRDHDPAFILRRLACILDELETEFADIKVERFVIIAHHQRNVDNRLLHQNDSVQNLSRIAQLNLNWIFGGPFMQFVTKIGNRELRTGFLPLLSFFTL